MTNMINKIKLKVVYLWYDYLTYRSTKVLARYFRLKSKIEALEVKYMNVEDKKAYWERLVSEAQELYSGDQFDVFEQFSATPTDSISEDLKSDVLETPIIDIKDEQTEV